MFGESFSCQIWLFGLICSSKSKLDRFMSAPTVAHCPPLADPDLAPEARRAARVRQAERGRRIVSRLKADNARGRASSGARSMTAPGPGQRPGLPAKRGRRARLDPCAGRSSQAVPRRAPSITPVSLSLHGGGDAAAPILPCASARGSGTHATLGPDPGDGGGGAGHKSDALAMTPNRKWRRISLKTLETDSEMAGPTPSLTRGIRMRFLSWRPGLAVAAGPETGRNPLNSLHSDSTWTGLRQTQSQAQEASTRSTGAFVDNERIYIVL